MALRQHSSRQQISGSWYTYDSAGRPTWFTFGAGSWTAPGVYNGTLYRTSGPPFNVPHDAAPLNITEVGTFALVFSNREAADVTFVVDGARVAKRISRFPYSP